MKIKVQKIENNIKQCISELAKQRNENISKTIDYICETLGVTRGHIYNIIRGDRNPSQELQFALAALFDKKVEEIFLPVLYTENTHNKKIELNNYSNTA